jgi:hypothetical protein
MVEELPAIVRIKSQEREGQPLLDLARSFHHARCAFIPYRPTFGPTAQNVCNRSGSK